MSDFIPGQVIVCEKDYILLEGPFPLSHPEASFTYCYWIRPGTPMLFWEWLGCRNCAIFYEGQLWHCDSRAHEPGPVNKAGSCRLKVKRRKDKTFPFPDWRVVTMEDVPWNGDENE
jgi:hypothetical protein